MVKLLDFWAEWCIDPQTPILTEDGYLPATQIKDGQKLITVDPQTYEQSIKTIQKVRTIKNVPSQKITLESGKTLIADANHLVLTVNGFKPVNSLELDQPILVLSRHLDQGQNKYAFLQLTPQGVRELMIQGLQIPSFINETSWEKVIDIENAGIRDVIGITVGSPHTIVTNGIVSHNCGPCKFMEPILDELEKELASKITIEKINVDEKPDDAAKYGVMSIPTYIVLKDDKEVERIIGATSKDKLLAAINKNE